MVGICDLRLRGPDFYLPGDKKEIEMFVGVLHHYEMRRNFVNHISVQVAIDNNILSENLKS